MSNVRAFTLIELLVVIGIVAVLAGMLMPALGAVKKAAQGVRCQSSLRQLGLAAIGYSQEQDGMLPSMRTYAPDGFTQVHWFQALGPQLDLPGNGPGGAHTRTTTLAVGSNPVWGCPLWRTGEYRTIYPAGNLTKPGYGSNRNPLAPEPAANWWLLVSDWLAGAPNTPRDFLLHAIPQSSSRVLYGDAVDWSLGADLVTKVLNDPRNGARHGGRATYVFMDGHTATLIPSAAALAIVDPKQAP